MFCCCLLLLLLLLYTHSDDNQSVLVHFYLLLKRTRVMLFHACHFFQLHVHKRYVFFRAFVFAGTVRAIFFIYCFALYNICP